MSADDDLIAELRDGERSVPLDQAADDRIRERMAAAFGAEQSDAAPVTDLSSYAEARATARATRARVAFIVAAAALVLLAVTAPLFLPDRDDTSPADDAEQPDVIDDDPAPRTDRDLGYLPFSDITFRAAPNADQTEALNITERTGERAERADGGATLALRRAISGSLVSARDFQITLEFTADGAILVPIEFIAPAFAAGAGCRGGSIDLNQLEQQLITAECGGDTIALAVRARAGEPDSLGILAEPVRATPTTYEIIDEGDVVAISTLWFDQAGLVRIDLDINGTVNELPMTATALTRRNIDLGLTEPAG